MTEVSRMGRRETTGSGLLWIAWGMLLLLLALLLCSSWQGPDIFYHLNLGKRVIETGHAQPPETVIGAQPRYVNVYWIYQVVSHLLYSAGGPVAVSLFMMGVWIGFFLLCRRISKASLLPAVGLPVTLASILIVQGRFDPRPDAVAWLFTAAWIHWLTAWDFSQRLSWRKLALACAAQVVWTNVHGYFAFGPLLVAVLLLSNLFDPDNRARSGEIAKLFGLVMIASFVSPFGPKAWRFVFDLWRFGGQMRDAVIEVRPPTGEFWNLWTVKLFWGYWGATILLAAFLIWKKKAQLFPLFLLLAGLFLSARSVRYMPSIVLFSAPSWGLLAAGRGLPASSKNRPGRGVRTALWIAGATALVALALSIWAVTGGFYRSVSSPARFGITLPAYAYPTRVSGYLKAGGFTGKIFNDSSDGGYVPYQVPGVRVYMDPRYIEPAIVTNYFSALKRRDRFDALHQQHLFDGVLLQVSESPELLQSLLADPKWSLAYADLHRGFLVPSGKEGSAPQVRFYQGEDLEQMANGKAAIEWTVLLVRSKDRAMLMQLLDQIDRSRRIPSFVIQYALGFGMQTKDAELVAKGRGMYTRMVARTPADRATVDRLMLLTSDGSGGAR